MAVNESLGRRVYDRRLFAAAAVLFPLIIFAGFARTYYIRGFFDTPPIPSTLVHVHGVLMTIWVLFFGAQVWLIRSRSIRLHQRLGYAGVAIAAAVIVVGVLTAIAATKAGGSTSSPPGIPPLAFMLVPIMDMVNFAVFFAAAVYFRKNAANHKRLMLLTAINFLPPALARIPFDFVVQAGPLLFFGIPTILAIGFIVLDTWKNKKLNKVFLAASMFMIATFPLRLIFAFTETWMQIAARLTTII